MLRMDSTPKSRQPTPVERQFACWASAARRGCACRYTSRHMNHRIIAFTATSRSRLLNIAAITVCVAMCQGCAYFAPKYVEPSEAGVGGPPPQGYIANGCLAEGVAGLGNLLNGK